MNDLKNLSTDEQIKEEFEKRFGSIEKQFLNEKSAIKYVENIIWKNGKKCPHCQNTNQKRIYEIKSTKARLGTHKCADCKKQFTVKVKSFHISAVNVATIKPILKEALYQDTNLMTDEATWYKGMNKEFKTHEFVRHSAKEYVKDGYIHTNTIEGYFGLFKRGMKGIYQHCKSQHLKRYLCEFDFRYNRRDLNDVNRAVEIVANAFGKRLKYKEVLVA